MLPNVLTLLGEHRKSSLMNISLRIDLLVILFRIMLDHVFWANILFEVFLSCFLHTFQKDSLLATSCLDPCDLRFLCLSFILNYDLTGSWGSVRGRKACPEAPTTWLLWRVTIWWVHKILHLRWIVKDAKLPFRFWPACSTSSCRIILSHLFRIWLTYVTLEI